MIIAIFPLSNINLGCVQKSPFFYNPKTYVYSKTCLKWPLKKDKTKFLIVNGNLMRVESVIDYITFALY